MYVFGSGGVGGQGGMRGLGLGFTNHVGTEKNRKKKEKKRMRI